MNNYWAVFLSSIISSFVFLYIRRVLGKVIHNTNPTIALLFELGIAYNIATCFALVSLIIFISVVVGGLYGAALLMRSSI